MAGAIRVLIIDDAVVVRRLLTEVLGEDPDVEVVGTAANGRLGLQKIAQLNPDVVVLDIEMPELDGLGTLAELRKVNQHLPVIMFSTLTERGAAATLDALTLGASDYVTKPANVGSVAASLARMRDELLPKVRALGGRRTTEPRPRPARPARPLPLPVPTADHRRAGRVDIVVIGVSTGGPNALVEIMPALPANFPAPILIVQHMPAIFTRLLAERLDAKSRVTVREAADGDPIEPGLVLIAPGEYHMVVAGPEGARHVVLNQEPPENSCRPAADPLFRSAAAAYGPGTLAVVLTGMGYDGKRGAEEVRAAGGQVLAQDQASSVVWGMPGAVSEAGLVDAEVPLASVADAICQRASVGKIKVAAEPAETVG